MAGRSQALGGVRRDRARRPAPRLRMAPGRRALWIFDDAPIFGGAELFALRLARWLGEGDHGRDVRLVCPPGSELAERCRAHGVPMEPLTFHKPRAGSAALRTPAPFRSVRRLLAGAGP